MKNIIYFISSLSILLISSCNTAFSTPWIFVNISEINNLLSTPEEVNINNTNYKLNAIFKLEQNQYGRGGIFGPRTISSSPKQFGINISESTDPNKTNNNIIINNFWVINNKYGYYYKANNIEKDKFNTEINNYFIAVPLDYSFNENDVAVIKFQFKNKDYYLKQKIIN